MSREWGPGGYSGLGMLVGSIVVCELKSPISLLPEVKEMTPLVDRN